MIHLLLIVDHYLVDRRLLGLRTEDVASSHHSKVKKGGGSWKGNAHGFKHQSSSVLLEEIDSMACLTATELF